VELYVKLDTSCGRSMSILLIIEIDLSYIQQERCTRYLIHKIC